MMCNVVELSGRLDMDCLAQTLKGQRHCKNHRKIWPWCGQQLRAVLEYLYGKLSFTVRNGLNFAMELYWNQNW